RGSHVCPGRSFREVRWDAEKRDRGRVRGLRAAAEGNCARISASGAASVRVAPCHGRNRGIRRRECRLELHLSTAAQNQRGGLYALSADDDPAANSTAYGGAQD